MGIYLRKSIRVGPFRFNLSKSGVGVSAGIKGFRLGTGPCGNYVHMGAGGLYYRKTLNSSRSHPGRSSSVPGQDYGPRASTIQMREIESGDVSGMAHSSSVELLHEIAEKEKAMAMLPWSVAAAGVLLAFLFLKEFSIPLLIIGVCVSIALILSAVHMDGLRKTVVLFYDLDPTTEQAYELLIDHGTNLGKCGGVWHVSASGKVHDRKYHAGASDVIDRKPTTIEQSSPHFLKTNIRTLAISVGRQVLYFFPDRILVYDRGSVGAVGYDEIRIEVNPSRFIESSTPPADAEIVDHTWRYVNKKGGPDKRFANNVQLPICRYEELHFTSRTGLNEILQLSRHSLGAGFVQSVEYLGQFAQEIAG
ncbi:DUF4236 domain-containing protein [Prosthecobacter sp.]|uniref:DUF4236 domain-containing protein n=1 Tax=Prosthecobacter sp. TaxID=1965333 RepID=UPI0037844392